MYNQVHRPKADDEPLSFTDAVHLRWQSLWNGVLVSQNMRNKVVVCSSYGRANFQTFCQSETEYLLILGYLPKYSQYDLTGQDCLKDYGISANFRTTSSIPISFLYGKEIKYEKSFTPYAKKCYRRPTKCSKTQYIILSQTTTFLGRVRAQPIESKYSQQNIDHNQGNAKQ